MAQKDENSAEVKKIETEENSPSTQNSTESTCEKKKSIFDDIVDYDLSENFAPLQPLRKSVGEEKEGKSFQKKEVHLKFPAREYQILKIISILNGKSIIQLLLDNLTEEFQEKMKNFESYI